MNLSRFGLGALVILVAGACARGGESTPTATATIVPSVTSTIVATPTSVATARPATVVPTATTVASDAIPGLFREPRFEEPDARVELGPRPASVFPDHDGRSVVLYDTVAGTATAFGNGVFGTFSPDGQRMAWAEHPDDLSEAATLRVIALETGAVSNFGEVRAAGSFWDDRYVRVSLAERNRMAFVDLETGERRSLAEIPTPPLPAERFTLRLLPIDQSGESVARVFADGELVLSVDVLDAKFASEDEIVILIDAGEGIANIFIVDLELVEATFVATTLTEPFVFSTIPLVANQHHVVWTPNACDFDVYQTPPPGGATLLERRDGSEPKQGRTMIFERATGRLTELTDSSLWVAAIAPDGRLVDGGFGGDALIDPGTISWDLVLPSIDIRWSPDYRYATSGELLGHGGVCPTP